jgi:hypothetical protein
LFYPARIPSANPEFPVILAGSELKRSSGAEPGAGNHVVVVDRDGDVADVLAAVLNPQGVSVGHQIPGRSQESETAAQVAVVDADSVATMAKLATMAESSAEAYVIVGRWRVPQDKLPARLAAAPVLDKPFRFPELISAVEQAIRRVA